MSRPRRWRTSIASAVTLALATTTAGCSLFADDPDPGVAAKAFAAGLSSGDLSAVAFDGTTPAEATAFVGDAFEGMDDVRPSVTVASVEHRDDAQTATATLDTVWDVSEGDQDWSYETQVQLELVEDAWQVVWSPSSIVPGLKPDEVLRTVTRWPDRADILDVNGAPLMTEREVVVVGLDLANLDESKRASSARALAGILGIDAAAYAERVAASGSKAFVPALTLRVDDPLLTKNAARIDRVPGTLRQPRMMVLGPSRTFAAPVLGSVGDATAEQIEKSDGTLAAGDTVGQSGLQRRYDEQLRGTPGLAVQAVRKGADGSVIGKRELFARQSVDGKPLQVTLDPRAQNAAEAALANAKTTATALVVVKASTGEVLAAAVGPGANNAPLALSGKNPPGSTFKVASSLAMVRKGATAATPVPCTETITVNGRVFANYTNYPKDKLGDIPLATALAYSCNTAFIAQHPSVSQDDLIRAAQSLGMGEDLDLAFAGFLGSVPPTEAPVEHAATFIGQGRVEASPLALAVLTASVISGRTVRPTLVVGAPELPAPPVPLQEAEAQVLRQEMSAVVAEGSGKVLNQVGVQYAKTGTAEFGTDSPPKTHAWMIAGRGDLAIAAFNGLGASGTTDAAPFIIDFLRAYDGAGQSQP